MLADDRISGDDDTVVIDEDGEAAVPGALLKSGTIDTYIAAVAELHRSQYSAGSHKEPILRGAALKALLEGHKQAQGTRNRQLLWTVEPMAFLLATRMQNSCACKKSYCKAQTRTH
jgi:hypothetical protein